MVMRARALARIACLAAVSVFATATGPRSADAPQAAGAGELALPGSGAAGARLADNFAPAGPSPTSAVPQETNVPYDGRFTFVRIRTDVGGGLGSSRGFRGRRGRGQPPWAHDYPRAERNFAKILTATTFVQAYEGGSNILTFDDPALLAYPMAYVSEPGWWEMNEAEREGLRNYLLKGGFVIFDDFGGRDWGVFEDQMYRVLPEGEFFDLSRMDPLPTIFDSFFEIPDPESLMPPYRGGQPQYFGIFEDNDPAKRLMLIANYNNDHGDYWEFSDSGWLPIDLTNEAYKFGVNYVIYAMTH